jgi:hypothetical protein
MPNSRPSDTHRSRDKAPAKQASGPDHDRVPGGQGRVKDPDHDGRLKENRGSGERKTR